MKYNNIDELRNIIKELSSKLKILEESNMVLREKQVLYCPRCG